MHIVVTFLGAGAFDRVNNRLRQVAIHHLADELTRGFGLRLREDVDHITFFDDFA